jgi:hypothetical protein
MIGKGLKQEACLGSGGAASHNIESGFAYIARIRYQGFYGSARVDLDADWAWWCW